MVLQGKTLPIKSEIFVKLFGGGANCYIPDFLGGEDGFNKVRSCYGSWNRCMCIFRVLTMKGYLNRKKNGYDTGSAVAVNGLVNDPILAVILAVTV